MYPALKRIITKHLRHGTWYAVIRNDQPDRLSLRVGPHAVDVPRKVVEVRDRRPVHFSVVSRLDIPAEDHSLTGELGRRYAVCPDCSGRTALRGEPPAAVCEHCGHRGEVGWWEA